MKRLIPWILLCAFCLCGCVSRQLEEELLVIVLGLDADEEQNIRLTVKVPSSASSQGKQEDDGYLLLSAQGHGFSDALTLLRATAPRQLNFSQVREVVFGERAAQAADFGTLLSQVDAIPRFRCSAAMIVCPGEARDFAAEQKPDLGVRLSRYTDAALAQSAGNGFAPDTDLCETVRDVGCGFEDPLLILGALRSQRLSDSLNTQNVLDAMPGSLPREGGSQIEIFGAAATDGVSVSGYLTGYEMALIHLMEGHAAALTVHQEKDVPLRLTARVPARLTVDLGRHPALLGLQLVCEVSYPPGHPPDEEKLARSIEADVRAVIAHLQALRCDGIGFGNSAVRQFLTIQDWEALDWRDVYVQAEVEISVSVQCRTG